MSANAQLIVVYSAVSPILIALLCKFRPKPKPPIKWLADYLYWFNTNSVLVRAQFEPKP